MVTESLVLQASMRGDLTREVRAAKQEVRELGEEARRTGSKATSGAAGLGRMEAASKRLERLAGQAHSRAKALGGYLGRELGQMARRGAMGLGVLITAVAGFGLKAASGFQQSRIAFDTLLGSVEKGGALFKELQALNLKTPFELGEIAPATQLLLRYGIAADRVVPTLKSLMDAAALSGNPAENLHRLSLAVGQIQQKGRVSGEEARQLAESGIDAYGLMADKLGITTAAARKLGEQGKLSADVFMEGLIALDGPLAKLAGGAEKMSGTLMGQLSNLKDAVMVRLADASAPLVERLTGMIPEITSLVGTAVDKLGPSVFNLVGLLVDGLAKALPIVAPVLATIVDGLGRLFTAAGPALTALAPLADQIAVGLVQLVDELVPVMPDLVDLFVALVMVLPTFLQLLTALVPLVSPLARLATTLLGYEPVRRVLAATLAVLLGYRAISGLVGGLHAFASALGIIGTQAQTAGGQAAVAQGRFAGLGRAAGIIGAGAGLYAAGTMINDRLHAPKGKKASVGSDLALVGTTAATGAAIGSIVPGIGTGVGALGGAAVGGGIALADRFFGDVKGNLAASSRFHWAAAGLTPGGVQVTSSLRGYGLASASSGHRRGTAWDARADFPQAYANNVRALGGFAAVHDDGSGRHVHSQIGDVTPAPWSAGGGPGGETLPPVQVIIERAYGQIDFELGVARGTAKGMDLHRRRRTERAHRRGTG